MTTPREKAIEKARKVFALGVSTPFQGEKEGCCQRLLTLMRAHRLVLHDLDRALPKRLDEALLRTRMGLKSSASGPKEPAGKQEPQDNGKAKAGTSGRAGPGGKTGPGGKGGSTGKTGAGGTTGTGGQAGPKKGSTSSSGRSGPTASSDPEVAVFQHLGAAERRRVLGSAMFSRGIGQAIQGTSAYPRLLVEVDALNRSDRGVNLTDQELLAWLDRTLSRQGSKVTCRAGSATIFDDLVGYCRFHYLADMKARHEAHARARAENEAARQRREAQAQREAEERARQQEAERQRAAAEEAEEEEDLFDWEVSFEGRAEADLYRKIALHALSSGGRGTAWGSEVLVVKHGTEFIVKLSGPDSFLEELDQKHAEVLQDLKQAAERIAVEAERKRDEAIARAHALYEQECEEALSVAVKYYRP